MLRRIGIDLGCTLVGYFTGAFGGGYLLSHISSNRHDRGVEAAITGAFVTGPLVAIIALIAGLLVTRGRP